jgi:hypothetical protein
MNRPFLLGILFLFPAAAFAQHRAVSILPEAGLSNPIGDFKGTNVFAKQGLQFGLHIDKMWGRFGLGLYGGFDKNDILYNDLLPENIGPNISRVENIARYDWRQFAAGAGPVLQISISKKINFELTSKLGLAKFSHPDFSKSLAVSEPLNNTYTLFQTRNEDIDKKLNPMLLSALRFNFQLTKRIDLSLAGNFKHVRNVLHSYSYLDADFDPGMSNEELIQTLRTAPTITETRKCYFNTVGVTLGLGFHIGGKPEEDEKIDPPVPEYPEDGATISMQEADSLVLQWRKESPPVEKAGYKLWLWKVVESASGADSLVLETKVKRSLQYTLPANVRLEAGSNYKWQVQAVDDRRLGACAGGCYSVEATFKVEAGASDQYYQLLTENSGNYIEARNRLRVSLPKNIHFMGKSATSRIVNRKNETVWKADEIIIGKNGENYTLDDYGRLAVSISRLPAGYYVFELETESKRTYYFRFQIVNGNERGNP